jgi:type IV pilus assembly protein PilC
MLLWRGQGRVDARMRSVFFRSLATMFSSGVGLVQALDMLGQQQEHADLAEACAGMAGKLQGGHPLSQTMQSYPWIFQPVHHKTVMSGERSGQLHAVLMRLAEREEQMSATAQKLKSSLTMPLLVSALCLTLAVAAPPLLLRGLFTMLAEGGAQPPWTTRVLIAFSAFVSSPAFLLLLAAVPFAVRALWSRLLTDATWQFRLLHVPHLGEGLRLLHTLSFVQNLRTMLDVGLPLLSSLELSARACDVACLDVVVARVTQKLKEGEELSDALQAADFFPASLSQAVRASEESGRMTRMLQNLESIYRLELDQRLEMLSRALEPLVLGLIGLFVGFTLVATLQPLLALLDTF